MNMEELEEEIERRKLDTRAINIATRGSTTSASTCCRGDDAASGPKRPLFRLGYCLFPENEL